MATAVLYTPDVLGLAIELARYPLSEAQPLRGEARSTSCGSTIMLGLALDDSGRITQVGVRSQACAIGQAAAAIFAGAAAGRSPRDVREAHRDVAAWLSGEGDLPDWPGFATIAAARDYSARHGAVMLPWNAAVDALSSAASQG